MGTEQVRDMLHDGRIHLLTADLDTQEEATKTVLRAAAAEEITVIYTNFSRPYTFLVDMLSDAGINTGDVFFIDPVSQTVQASVEEQGNVVYVDSPAHLTDINIAVSTALENHGGETVVVLDALSDLEVHNKVDEAVQFLHHLTNELRSSDVSAILLSDGTGSTELQAGLRKNTDDYVAFERGGELAFS